MSSPVHGKSQAPHTTHGGNSAPGLLQGVSDGVLREFLESSVALVADSGVVTRNALRKFLIDLGMMQSFCMSAPTFIEAKSLLSEFQPKILVLEADQDPQLLNELLSLHRKQFSNFKDSILIVLHSGDLSEQTAEAVRQGADIFLKKPFSLERFKYRFAMAVAAKSESSFVPPIYQDAMELIGSRADEEALAKLRTVVQIYPECPKALREMARIHLQRQNWQEAERWVWRLREENLLDPEWIPDVIEMASKIDRYDYVEWLADAVREMPKSKVRIISSVAHGIALLAARLASSQKDRPRALELFQKAVSVSKHAHETYSEVIQAMYSAEMIVEADILLRSAPDEVRESEDTKILLLEHLDQHREAPEVINAAYQLYRAGVRRPRVYQVLIERSKELGRTRQVIVELIEEAGRVHPDWTETFNGYL